MRVLPIKTCVLIIIILLILTPGCIDAPEKEGQNRFFIDEAGNEVKIVGVPKTIISLAPSVTEILYFLGLEERVVGIDAASDYPPEVSEKDVVASFGNLNIEAIISKAPDLIVMDKTLDMSGAWYQKLVEAEFSVYQLFPNNIEDVITQMKVLANITDIYPSVIHKIEGLEARVLGVENLTRSIINKPTVLYINYYDGTDNPWVGTKSTVSGDLIKMAGGIPLIDESTDIYLQISLETVILSDPDIIISSHSNKWWDGTKEVIMNDDRLSSINAVKNDHVYDIDADLIERPGPRIVDGLESIAQIIADYGDNI
ncbi:ABC transporter substrate-binding protein [[Eubacterium] cellulosolvens]